MWKPQRAPSEHDTDFNRRNQNRIEFEKSVPQESEISSIAEHYGTQIINWSEKDGKAASGCGICLLDRKNPDALSLILSISEKPPEKGGFVVLVEHRGLEPLTPTLPV